MIVLDRNAVESKKDEIVAAIQSGAIFIYPTDTIYGIGCDATNDGAVAKLREIKRRETKPFSVIAPGKEWIREHCIVPGEVSDLGDSFYAGALDKLPGPYTLILNCHEGSVSKQVNPGGNTLGVRIPDHWFAEVVAAAAAPFVTTSVNLSGEKHMEAIEDVPQDILDQVDYVIYEGPKRGVSSEKIDLTSASLD